jgi:NAD(P)-dependent dehydrogenase (short-subunit alcohol dehydrogenase family)
MGRACARELGATMDLVLSDASPGLHDFARELQHDGYAVRETIVGDFRSDAVLGALGRQATQGFAALVHAAGLPPSAPWRDVVEVNFVATVKLLEHVGSHVTDGTAAVLIASVAGHVAPEIAEAKALFAAPLSPTFLDELEAILRCELGPAADRAMGTLAYALSKRQVIDLCEAHAADWGRRGGRIVSISPGMIYTPMGRSEAELDEAAEAQVKSAPAGRWGTVSEIAAAASFLLSPAARFITGTDLRVDGGAFGAMRSSDLPPWIDMLRDRMS